MEKETEAKEKEKVIFNHMCKCVNNGTTTSIQSKDLALDIVRISDTRSLLVCCVCKEQIATWDFEYEKKMFTR